MSHFDRAGTALDSPRRPRPGSRFGDLGDRLARTFTGMERTRPRVADWEEDEFDFEPPDPELTQALPDLGGGRFPITRNGYERRTVERHIEALEQEIEDLRISRRDAVADELDRIGEQTSVILRTAHRQAQEIVHDARAQADRCLQDAASNAVKMTEQAKERQRTLDVETDSIWAERARLLEDAREVAQSLMQLVDDAASRIPLTAARPAVGGRVAPAPALSPEDTVAIPAPVPAHEPFAGAQEPAPGDQEPVVAASTAEFEGPEFQDPEFDDYIDEDETTEGQD